MTTTVIPTTETLITGGAEDITIAMAVFRETQMPSTAVMALVTTAAAAAIGMRDARIKALAAQTAP